jgi:NAD(P)-dependent dehydrogenase (short-subunit alcohol dehydrogenase family)
MTEIVPLDYIQDRLVMGRMGRPQELAAALIFLASDAAGYVSASELIVHGGFTLT